MKFSISALAFMPALFAVILPAIFDTQPVKAQSSTSDDLANEIETEIKNFLRPYNGNIAHNIVVGIVSPSLQTTFLMSNYNINGKPQFTNESYNTLPLTAKTPFAIGSITKTFTATLFAKALKNQPSNQPSFVEATLGQYLTPQYLDPAPPLASTIAGLKLGQLATYSSGLPTDNIYPNPQNPSLPPNLQYPYELYVPGLQPGEQEGLYQYLSTAPPPTVENVGDFAYSNLGFALLAQALPQVLAPGNGYTYEELVSKFILDELSMSATHFYTPADNASLPRGLNTRGENPTMTYSDIIFPAYNGGGALVSTPNDMQNWLLFNMGLSENSQLNPLLPILQTPQYSGVGYGWFFSQLDNGQEYVWKNGAVPSFASWMGFLDSDSFESKIGVFVLTNDVTAINAPDRLGYDILQMLVAVPEPNLVPALGYVGLGLVFRLLRRKSSTKA